MIQVIRQVPLSALDWHCFLAGVLVDPVVVSYTIRDGSLAIVSDEDGLLIQGRPGRRVGVGRFDAGNTVLGGTLPTGTYSIEWTFQKTPGYPVARAEVFFDLVDRLPEDPTREEVSRRDTPDAPLVSELRTRIQDLAPDDRKWAFFNSELKTFVVRALAMHTEGRRNESTATDDDVAMVMLLAHASALRALATDRSRFFRWQDGNEAVDKSMIPKTLLDICGSLMDEYRTITKRRIDERASGAGSLEPAGGRMEFRRR